MSNLDYIDLKLVFVFSKSSILILFFILQGIIMSLIIESVLAADVQSQVVTKKKYNPFASLLEIESFSKGAFPFSFFAAFCALPPGAGVDVRQHRHQES